MARRTNAEIEQAVEARLREIDEAAEKKFAQRLPGIITDIVSRVTAQVAATGGTGGPSQGEIGTFANALGTTIARMSKPDGMRTIVAPEVQAERDKAWTQMVDLLVKLKAASIWPIYYIKAPCFLNNMLVEPEWRDEGTKRMEATRIRWDREPNEAMVPDPNSQEALEVWRLYKLSKGTAAPTGNGMPPPPWIDGAANWIKVRGREGIMLGRGPAQIPEISAAESFALNDPRLPGQDGGQVRRTINVLGTEADPVVELAGNQLNPAMPVTPAA